MVAIRGRFDGKVFIPEDAVDLPRNQRVILHVEPVGAGPLPQGATGEQLRKLVGAISPEDLRLMSQAIAGDCERVDQNDW